MATKTQNNGGNVGNVSVKGSPIGADYAVITDSAASNNLAIATISSFPAIPGALASIYPTPISGYYYHGMTPSYFLVTGYTSGITAFSTGTLYFVPFYNYLSTAYSGIGIMISVFTGAGNCNMGIYNSAVTGTASINSYNARPTGTPITNSTSGSLAVAATGVATFSFGGGAITLAPGLYWLAYTQDTNTSTSFAPLSIVVASMSNAGGVSSYSTSTANYYIGGSQAFTYNTTLPTATAATNVQTLTGAHTLPVPFLIAN